MTTRILPRGSFSVMERRPEKCKKGRRPLEPSIFARVEEFADPNGAAGGERLQRFAFYFSIQREGDFRRVELPLVEARDWLRVCWQEVVEAIDRQQAESRRAAGEVATGEELERR